MTRIIAFLALVALFAVPGSARAQDNAVSAAAPPAAEDAVKPVPSPAAYQTSGLPIPRFVSLRADKDKVFVRSGPALRYPVKWIYQKEKLPVEVIQEFDTWRKIRDFEGDEGWIHQSLLSGQRTVLIKADDLVPLQKDEDAPERLVAKLEPDVIADLTRCDRTLCEVSAGGFSGWADRKYLWGIYADEELD